MWKHSHKAGLAADALFLQAEAVVSSLAAMPSEADRLAVLRSYDILDTPPERAFDDIVLLARQIADVPIALVSLVDSNRQWFKARVGIDAIETPIASSVCAHAIQSGDMLVINDLTADERTRRNPLVLSNPKIRFYAGAVIQTSQGVPLGTVCVIDVKSRPAGLTSEQTDALLALARQTSSQIEMRRAVDVSVALAQKIEVDRVASRAEESRLRLAQEAGQIGTFEIEIATDIAHVSEAFCRIYGLPLSQTFPSSVMESLVIPDEEARASTKSERTKGTALLYSEYRIRRPNDGSLRWIARKADFQSDAGGKPILFIGAVQDITDRKVIQIRQEALLQLGDKLRQARSTDDVLKITSEILGTMLVASRAGYAFLDIPSDRVVIEHDWAEVGVERLTGERSVDAFRTTLEHLKAGRTLAISQIASLKWLGDDVSSYGDLGVEAQIAVPLIRNDQLVGVLYAHATDNRNWSKGEIDFATAVADRAFAAIERNQAEAEQNLLNHELSHRLKNSFAMVQAIATQTLREVGDKSALAAFNSRISALSKAHDILIGQRGTSARIKAVMVAGISLQASADRFFLEGPDLLLGPKATLSLSLLIHELATNAIKHGALSNSTGTVSVHWAILHHSSEPIFVLEWKETGGPPVIEPRQAGFGSRLIRLGLSGTRNTELHYRLEGLDAKFEAPLSILLSEEV